MAKAPQSPNQEPQSRPEADEPKQDPKEAETVKIVPSNPRVKRATRTKWSGSIREDY